MARKKDKWTILVKLITDYRDAAVAESWKGGGDPLESPVIYAHYQLANAKLLTHIEQMRREENDDA